MHNLEVNSELDAIVVDDKDTDAATTIVKSLCKTLKQAALIEDRKTLLDITGLGHGDNATILADIKDAVLLEDGAEHVLHDDRRRRVGDEGGLFMELLGEEIHAEVAVLARLAGGGDADHLARAALEDQEIANADVVAGDGDGVGGRHAGGRLGLDDAFDGDAGSDAGDGGEGGSGGGILFLDYDFFATGLGRGVGRGVGRDVGVGSREVVRVGLRAVDGVDDAVGCFVKTVAERVVVAVFVVISHITLVLLLLYDNVRPSFACLGGIAGVDGLELAAFETGRGVGPGGVVLLDVLGWLAVAGVGGEVVKLALLKAS
jgi:hypothetical protein